VFWELHEGCARLGVICNGCSTCNSHRV
jgi:hypothetical protein